MDARDGDVHHQAVAREGKHGRDPRVPLVDAGEHAMQCAVGVLRDGESESQDGDRGLEAALPGADKPGCRGGGLLGGEAERERAEGEHGE
jgi:hypothetical protein